MKMDIRVYYLKKRKTGSGRKPKLNIKQRNELYKILIEEEDLTIHDIQKIIEDKYNKKYTYMGVKKLIENGTIKNLTGLP